MINTIERKRLKFKDVQDRLALNTFIPVDENGRVIVSAAGRYPAPELPDIRDRLYDIRGVDIRITFRSKDDFFKKKIIRKIESIKGEVRHINEEDKFLRDSIVLSVFTRNIGN